MAFESLRSRLEIGSGSRRYATDVGRLPEDVSDPATLRDESTPTLFERIMQYRWYLLTVSVFIVVGVLYSIAIGIQIFPELIQNRIVQVAFALLVAFGIGYVVATLRAFRVIRDIPWLNLNLGDGLDFYPGWFLPPVDEDDDATFVPCKGLTLFGHRRRPLQIREVNPSIAQRWANANRDPEDPAEIRLDPSFYEHRETEWGHVVAQASDGLEIDTLGRESQLVATSPNMAHEDRVEKMEGQLRDSQKWRQHYEQMADDYRRQRDNIADYYSQPIDELLDEEIDRGVRIAEAGRPDRRTRSRADTDEELPPMDRELEDVDQELTADD